MTETTWTSAAGVGARPGMQDPSLTAVLGRFWASLVTAPLHRALNSALRAGELGALDASTLADIGYRRG